MAFSRTVAHATAADGTFSAAGATAWNGTGAHSPAVAGADVGGIPYCPTATTETTSAGFTYNASGAAGEGLAVSPGTATTDVAALSVTRTNNNSAIARGVEFTFTDTSSASGFLPLRIRGGASGTTQLIAVTKAGRIIGDNATPYLELTSGGGAVFGYGTSSSFFSGGAAAVFVGGNGVMQWTANDARSAAAGILSWAASGGPAQASDSGISRISAGILGVGTGAAGSFAGSLKLTDLTAVGNIQGAYKSSDGTAGVSSFGPSAVTSITVKDGIIVAIS